MAEWGTLIEARSREIRVSGSITFNTGTAVALTGDHIASFTITEGADSALTPGCVLCAECVLELSAVPYTLTGMTIVSAAGEAGPVKRQRAITMCCFWMRSCM